MTYFAARDVAGNISGVIYHRQTHRARSAQFAVIQRAVAGGGNGPRKRQKMKYNLKEFNADFKAQ